MTGAIFMRSNPLEEGMSEKLTASILVVDDVEENVDMLLNSLDDDYEVIVALNGMKAIEIIAEEHPDIILLDIMMPEMDGYEVCRRLKADAKTRDIPVIFISALSDIDNEAKGLELGAVDYISKPFNPAIVNARLKTHLALSDQKRVLEKMVSERTVELEDKNRELIDQIAIRERAEQEARHQSELLRNILDGIQAAFFVIDRENGTILSCNNVIESMLGLKIEPGRTVSCRRTRGVKSHNLLDVLCANMDDALRYEEILLSRTDDTIIPVALFSFAVDKKRQAILLMDISERKNLERQLNLAQKMESIGVLASGIAHEINTPIQYIGSNIRFLQETWEDMASIYTLMSTLLDKVRVEDSCKDLVLRIDKLVDEADMPYLLEEVPSSIKSSLDGVERVAAITRAMKSFAHPGTESMKAVDLNIVIEDTVAIAKNEWKYVADMRLQLAEDLPLVTCLPGEINQVILNLIVNAAHAIEGMVSDTGGMGTITVSTSLKGDFAEIRISDTGIGIPLENMEKIYDPFFTTKEIGKGSGQGLSIAHGIVVNKHGGTIDVSSEVGKGTTFCIRLPVEGCADTRH